MSESECRLFEHKLALHTAPTLLGIKCASLISLSNKELDIENHTALFNRKAAVKGLKIRTLCRCDCRTLLLIYHERLMAMRLADESVTALLEQWGYTSVHSDDGGTSSLSPDEYIKQLSQRLDSCEEFPHEIGLFLGYPIEDVEGFIENKGEKYKLCGCWKVYGNEDRARRIFSNYDKCRAFLCNKLNSGKDIYQALKIS